MPLPESLQGERFWRERQRPFADDDILKLVQSAPAQQNSMERMLLFTLVRSLSPRVAVEVGSFQGGSALIISKAMDYAGVGQLWAIDPRPQFKIDWNAVKHRVHLVEECSPEAYTRVAREIPSPVEFAFIDGIHSREAVIADTKGVIPLLAGDAWLLYHDAMADGVRRGIDECVQSIPGLSDCGMLCRFFNNDVWPKELMGGMRLLHFQSPDRPGWIPKTADQPGDERLPANYPPAIASQVHQEVESLIQQKRTPVALYGHGLAFGASVAAIGDLGEHIACVFDDDPLMHGNVCLGWPIVDPDEREQFGIKSVYVTEPDSSATQSRLSMLREAGLTVIESQAGTVEPTKPGWQAPMRVMETLKRSLYIYGARRVALYGAGELTQSIGGRLARTFGKFIVQAIVDNDRSRKNQRLWGLPIVSSKELVAMKPKFDWVILSMDEKDAKWADSRQLFEKSGIRVAESFDDFPSA